MSIDRNCLSFWFSKIEDGGLPVPKTEIVPAPPGIGAVLDGLEPVGWAGFVAELRLAANHVGDFPIFLRTGLASGKHRWERTCFVQSHEFLGRHVVALVEFSAMADLMGLPCDVWAVREMLPTTPVLTLPAYGNMPLCREFRCFVRDGDVLCVHPYWPWRAVERGFQYVTSEDPWTEEPVHDVPPGVRDTWRNLCVRGKHECEIRSLASRAGTAVGGEWSVDVLETERGWVVIDMAEASRSWHWPDCPVAKTLQDAPGGTRERWTGKETD